MFEDTEIKNNKNKQQQSSLISVTAKQELLPSFFPKSLMVHHNISINLKDTKSSLSQGKVMLIFLPISVSKDTILCKPQLPWVLVCTALIRTWFWCFKAQAQLKHYLSSNKRRVKKSRWLQADPLTSVKTFLLKKPNTVVFLSNPQKMLQCLLLLGNSKSRNS